MHFKLVDCREGKYVSGERTEKVWEEVPKGIRPKKNAIVDFNDGVWKVRVER